MPYTTVLQQKKVIRYCNVLTCVTRYSQHCRYGAKHLL